MSAPQRRTRTAKTRPPRSWRLACVVVHTRQPDGRPVECHRTRHHLACTGEPVRFIAAGARLVPGQQPWRLVLSALDANCSLTLNYAADDRGRETSVNITLRPADMPALFAYGIRQPPVTGVLFVPLEAGAEGDPVTVPLVTVSMVL